MSKSLSGKRAFVTGGSRGIGAAIVQRLAADGADVGFTYANAADRANAVVQGVEAAGAKGLAIRADSSDAAAVSDAVEQTAARFGGLDILVNSAGIIVLGPVDEIKLADFDRIVAVNIRAVFVAIQAALKHMKSGSRIINIGSTNADRMPFVGGSVYAMTKAALVGLVKGVARDLGPRGITINNIQPGPIDTESNPASGDFSKVMLSLMALQRYGTA
ncbi:MAG TPA: SDR family NAD(P)-dependent oxidoreductase, partial [Tepidisphaeraceae bacterium]